MSKTFPLSTALCRLGLAGCPQEARALVHYGLVRVDGDCAKGGEFVGYGVTLSLRGVGERVVSRQTMGVQ
ncbi:hypothetical protein B0W47_00575 [Komagataeibacter nataicola]|uniref:RNA-binding S4 domain-containing protein n=1 Tax=Komagataeibacter nataicola TaxID=265960 RepID=A0A9N7CPF8_9PROT|nr:hypothetical protein [Komagataeibacter nataicola]AQU86196.1 hypothetical protein B0W47_00575 [Komagataeibacter nataicola]PYD65331.1 hypothetical protein CDI09_14080 [Komagataeibacter nataicola]WNM08401.1 hypothetical protein RI056_16310 [Komagataeibacter nataicola]GBR23025.1 hypothetical protein AA0616_2423 [Komagataeibacter nataicola NRIC 0616]